LLKRFETTKLFYDEYPYKVTLKNNLGHIFRDKNLAFAKQEIDRLQQKYDQGLPLVRVAYLKEHKYEVETFLEARDLYIEFSKQDDYKLRIQNPYMQIYSHDYDWLHYISEKIKSTFEFWEPNQKLPTLEKNVIVVEEEPEYLYKVTLDSTVDANLASWIRNNPGKAKAGRTCLETIENNGFCRGFYFFVRDDKILQLLNLFIGKVQRIDKLVSYANSDK